MEFASWSREEQKSRLKEWNAKAKQLKATCQPSVVASTPEGDRSDSASTFVGTPAYVNNEAPASKPVERAQPLTSVAAIQASYKSRWRSDEAKRFALVKRTPHYQSWDDRRRLEASQMRVPPAADVNILPQAGDNDEFNGSVGTDNCIEVHEDAKFGQDDVWLQNLSYVAIARDSALKQQVLGHIRAALLQGQVVHLKLDAQAIGDSVADSRLLAQQLTIASLLFCDRTQEIVPRTQGNLQVPLHRRGSDNFSAFGEDVVKMEAMARTGEPSAAMKDFGGSIDVDLVTRHMALLTAPTPSPPLHVEDIPMLDNIMDDEQHAAVETEKYERMWPAGKMFGDDDKDVDPDQTT
ncbi:hypothetical protein B5M09_007579 [Aphanomyces astaci]|uniref:Uncharacterized protein n=1 Tax=Aphanomyces astaci TaxID=112090 RepID=A0A425D517_APHAT|nr:hypothetical protein B5M09_007579 [Aphanomyces astaci]